MARIISFVVLVAILSPVYTLDEESAKEGKCFEVKKTVPVDLQWLASQKTIYYPLMSRLDLYRTSSDVVGREIKNISENEVYYEGCIKFTIGSDGAFDTTGFNGVRAKFVIKPTDPGLERFEFGEKDGFTGHCSTTLTDNKTFVFFVCCSNGNEVHWATVSSLESLPKATVKIIHEHAESLGFSKQQFTSLRYDSCDKKGAKEEL